MALVWLTYYWTLLKCLKQITKVFAARGGFFNTAGWSQCVNSLLLSVFVANQVPPESAPMHCCFRISVYSFSHLSSVNMALERIDNFEHLFQNRPKVDISRLLKSPKKRKSVAKKQATESEAAHRWRKCFQPLSIQLETSWTTTVSRPIEGVSKTQELVGLRFLKSGLTFFRRFQTWRHTDRI